MHSRRQLRALVLLLVLFVGFGVTQSFLVYRDVQLWLAPFGFVSSNSSNASSAAVGTICIGYRPPVIADIPDQSAAADTLFQYTVNATQANGNALTFTDDTALFTIGSSTGLISFTPSTADVGSSTITITASDSQGCSASNDSDSFVLTITANATTPAHPPPCPQGGCHPAPLPHPQPPRPFLEPYLPMQAVFAPYYVLDIWRIVANGAVLYDQNAGIQLAEYLITPNALITFQVTVRNVGFNQLTSIQLDLPIPANAQVLAINPAVVNQLDPNQEAVFTVQLQTGDQPFDLVLHARADQDEDTEVLPVIIGPQFEKPVFGFEIPAWLPLALAIPLLFFLGYSLTKNKQLIREFLQNLSTGILAFLLRHTYLCDEGMLRQLIKANKVNPFIRYLVVPDIYARYHPQYRNLRTRELKQQDYDNIAILVRQYLIGGELATLLVLAEGKPRPRILTAFTPSKKLTHDYPKVKFLDPLRAHRTAEVKAKSPGAES